MRENKTIRRLQNKDNGNEWITFKGVPTIQAAGMVRRGSLAITPNATAIVIVKYQWAESPGDAFQYGMKLNETRNAQYYE